MPGRIILHIPLLGCLLLIGNLVFGQVGGMNPTAVPFPTENCGIQLDTIIVPPSCPGGNDGRLEIFVEDNGVPLPLSVNYHWINVAGQSTDGPFVDNLTAGTYACELTDMNGCLDTLVFHLQDPDGIEAIRNNATLCAGASTIPLLNAVAGGSPPYTFSYQSQNQLSCFNCANTNVTVSQSDVFSIQITDSNGCTSTENVFITVLDPLEFTSSSVPETCGDDGEIIISATGGGNNYSYSINDGPVSNVNNFTNLPSGDYNIVVEDDQGCTTTETVTIPTAQVLVDFTANVVNIPCFGEASGVIEGIDNNGAVAAFSLNDLDFTDPAGIYDGLSAGFYTLYAEDANGCITSQDIEIVEPDELIINLIGQDVTCPFGNDGSITIQAGGGVPGSGYLYSIDNDLFQPDPNFDNLSPGVYECIVKDTNGCEKIQSIVINAPAEPNVLVNKQDVSCPGANDASIVIIVSGGGLTNTNYQFSLDGANFQAGNTFGGLTSGTYTAFVQNDDGCTTTENFIIEEPDILDVQINKQEPSCPQINDASIVIIVSGGGINDIYQYSLDGVEYQDSNVFSELFAGVYTGYIQNQTGCVTTENFFLEDPPTPDINYNNIDATCSNAQNAEIVIIVSGGGVYDYSIDGVNYQDSNVFPGVQAGTYPVFVQENNGCTYFDITSVGAPPAANIQLQKEDVSCPGGNDASIVIIVSGGGVNDTYEYSLDGVEYQPDNDFFDLAAGIYTCYAKNQFNCITTEQVLVEEPDVPNINLVPSEVTCPGGSNGSIVIIVSGGGIYEYSLDGINYQPQNSFDGLNSGLYQVYIRDENDCVFLDNQFIDEPIQPNVNVNISPPNCPEENNASIVIIVSGGGATDTYQYSLTGGTYQPSNTFNDLGAGNYTAFIQNQDGCTTTQNFIVQDPPAPDLNLIGEDATCPGGTDGSIVIMVSGGGVHEYSLDGTNFQQSNTFQGLDAGFYTAYAMNDNGCIITESILINEPQAPNINVNISPISCPGENDASIVIIVSGGGFYEYSLDGSNYQSSNTFGSLSSGNYSAYIMNQDDCITTENFIIADIVAPNVSFSITDITCPSGQDGSIVAVVAGGVAPPFEYSLDGMNYQPSNSFVGLTAGVYSVYVRDAAGCVFINSAFVDEPLPPDINVNITPISCPDENDASIVIIVSGGGLYEYSLDGSNYQASNTFSNLVAGTYSAFVSDEDDCVTTAGFSVGNISAPNISLSITNVTCPAGTDGHIVAIVSGGAAPPYEYSLDGVTYQPSNSFAGLMTGLYDVYVRDAAGCVFINPAFVDEPPLPTVNTQITDASCPGSTDAIILVSVTGGGQSDIYEYSLDGVVYQSSNAFQGLSAGLYNVAAKNQNECIALTFAVVNEPTEVNIVPAVIDASCEGNSDGAISIFASGGYESYEYSLDGINFQLSNNFTGLGAGIYEVFVQDNGICISSMLVSLNEPPAPQIASSAQDVTCPSGNDGEIIVNITNGIGPFQYSIDDTNYQSTNVFSSLETGNYDIYIVDGNGCNYIDAALINEPQTYDVSFTVQDATCSIANGLIASDVSGATGPYNYLWSNGQTEAIATMLSSGYYGLTVTDTNNCTWSDSTLVLNENGPDANTTVIDVSCFGLSDGSITLEMISGTAPFTYTWSGGMTTQNISGQPAGNYKVTILDANNCLNLIEFVINEPQPIVISSTEWIENDLGQIDLEVSGGSPDYTFVWSNGSTTEDLSDLEEGIYTVTVTDFHGCTETAEVIIILTNTDGPLPEENIDIFPNPTDQSIYIKGSFQTSKPVNLEVFSVDGKLIYQETEIGSGKIDYELNLGGLPQGVYLLRLSYDTQSIVRKVIKQ
ncbi:MAG: T9SS type A sorting domain-containing protein [Bacteroidota bacterium]